MGASFRWPSLGALLGLTGMLVVAGPVGQAAAAFTYQVTNIHLFGTSTPNNPCADAIDPGRHNLYVVDGYRPGLWGYDVSTGTVSQEAQQVVALPGQTGSCAVAVDPGSHNVYVGSGFTATTSGLDVVDESGGPGTGTVAATIPLPDGVAVEALAVDPGNHNVYALCSDSTVRVINESGGAATGTITATIPFASGLVDLTVDPGNHNVYVTNSVTGTVSVLNESGGPATGTVTSTAGVTNASRVAVDPGTHKIYVTGTGNTVSVIDESGGPATGTVTATITLPNAIGAIAIDPGTQALYVVTYISDDDGFQFGELLVFDESGSSPTGAPRGRRDLRDGFFDIAIDPTTHLGYITNGNRGAVAGPYISVVTPVPVAPAIEATASGSGTGTATAQVAAPTAGDLLVAFVGSDGPAGSSAQASTVTGGGLTWARAGRESRQGGAAEIWTARASTPPSGAIIRATAAIGNYGEALTVIAVANSPGIGAITTSEAARGGPSGTLTTRLDDSLVVAAGNDWLRAAARVAGAHQTVLHQTLAASGDTYWAQATAGRIPTAGTTVTIDDTAPVADPYNLVLAEIL